MEKALSWLTPAHSSCLWCATRDRTRIWPLRPCEFLRHRTWKIIDELSTVSQHVYTLAGTKLVILLPERRGINGEFRNLHKTVVALMLVTTE